MEQSLFWWLDSEGCNQVDRDLGVHWILKIFPKLYVEFFVFLLSVHDILHQSLFPFFILSSLVFNFDKVMFKNAKNLLKFDYISLVDSSENVIENFLKSFLHQESFDWVHAYHFVFIY
jgi:hypothetical protein